MLCCYETRQCQVQILNKRKKPCLIFNTLHVQREELVIKWLLFGDVSYICFSFIALFINQAIILHIHVFTFCYFGAIVGVLFNDGWLIYDFNWSIFWYMSFGSQWSVVYLLIIPTIVIFFFKLCFSTFISSDLYNVKYHYVICQIILKNLSRHCTLIALSVVENIAKNSNITREDSIIMTECSWHLVV